MALRAVRSPAEVRIAIWATAGSESPPYLKAGLKGKPETG
jgi:hypothetical protein